MVHGTDRLLLRESARRNSNLHAGKNASFMRMRGALWTRNCIHGAARSEVMYAHRRVLLVYTQSVQRGDCKILSRSVGRGIVCEQRGGTRRSLLWSSETRLVSAPASSLAERSCGFNMGSMALCIRAWLMRCRGSFSKDKESPRACFPRKVIARGSAHARV